MWQMMYAYSKLQPGHEHSANAYQLNPVTVMDGISHQAGWMDKINLVHKLLKATQRVKYYLS